MKAYKVEVAAGVAKDIRKLKLSKPHIEKLQRKIHEIAKNPLPKTEGGYGEPVSSKEQKERYMKFRFLDDYRVIYTLVMDEHVMKVLVIGLRKDKEAYQELLKRI
ncbi:MAG: type II toxin-antitoxin system RelE/ParE family toxin [Bacillota bacterium]|nr:type II toxin-antitoxin system RelE/ParE family toxin [Bacillota bacterium]